MSLRLNGTSNFSLNKQALFLKRKKFFLRKKKSTIGQVHINRTSSNIFVTLTDLRGKVITTSCSGFVGFIKNKKVSPQAAYASALRIISVAKKMYIFNLEIVLHMRVNLYVYSVIRALKSKGLKIRSFYSKIAVPHNGIRGKHLRRK
jgi:ribosomal protein S11